MDIPLISGTGNGGQLRNGHLTSLRVVVALAAGIGVGTFIDVLQRFDKFLQIGPGAVETSDAGRRRRRRRRRRHRHRRYGDVRLRRQTQNALVLGHAVLKATTDATDAATDATDATDAGDGSAVDVVRSVLRRLAQCAEHDVIVVGAQIDGRTASRRCRRRRRHQLRVAGQRCRFVLDAGAVCDVVAADAVRVRVHRRRQRRLRRPRRRRRVVEAEDVALQTLELVAGSSDTAAIYVRLKKLILLIFHMNLLSIY